MAWCTTLSITTLGIKGLVATLSITIICHYAECHYAKCCASFMINVIMLSAIMLRVIMLIVVAPYGFANCFQTFHFLHLGHQEQYKVIASMA
jgi:hypothetical protein